MKLKGRSVLYVKNCLKDWRLNRGWTRSDLAVLAGTTENTIKAIENNSFIPSIYLALCLSTIFDCRVENIFTLEIKE